jgi:hypothetical protein
MNWCTFRCGAILLLAGLICPPITVLGQGREDAWQLLLKPDSLLRGDVIHTEEVIDLVDAWVVDSIVDKNKQRLKGLGGWIAQRTWARYWQHYTPYKQKYVGSSSRPYKIFDGMADEMDINIFLMPHLPRYVLMVAQGFDIANDRPRPDEGFRFDNPEGFPVPEQLKYEDRGYLTVECEITPNQEFADALHKLFLPTRSGAYGLDTVSNFGTKHPSVGMTGVWCMDCNHNCRPEIHPFEWLWWMDLSKNRPGSAQAKSWMVSLMVDASNRFRDWSRGPIAGEIAIPFVLRDGAETLKVDLQHIASDPVDLAMEDSLWKPVGIQSEDTTLHLALPLDVPASGPFSAEVRVHGGWPSQSTFYWIGEVQRIHGGYSGYFHIASTVTSMLSLRLTFDE